MKKIILPVTLIILFYPFFTLYTHAFNIDYSFHTTKKDIEFKKNKALAWNDIYNESELLKKKALKWYENNLPRAKDFFADPVKESEFKKTKALKWHDRNSL